MSGCFLTLPIPRKELWPNARPNRYAKAKAVKEARHMAWGIARRAFFDNPAMDLPTGWAQARTEAVFYFATNRRRDMDSLSSSLKAYWDGIADAGVIANDSGFVHHPPEMRVDKARPRVEVRIRPLPLEGTDES